MDFQLMTTEWNILHAFLISQIETRQKVSLAFFLPDILRHRKKIYESSLKNIKRRARLSPGNSSSIAGEGSNVTDDEQRKHFSLDGHTWEINVISMHGEAPS